MFKIYNKALEQRQWRRYGVFIANFEDASHQLLTFVSLTLNK